MLPQALALVREMVLTPSRAMATLRRFSAWETCAWLLLVSLGIACVTVPIYLKDDEAHPGWLLLLTSPMSGAFFLLLMAITGLDAGLVYVALRLQKKMLSYRNAFILTIWAGMPSLPLGFFSLWLEQGNWYTRWFGSALGFAGTLWWGVLLVIGLRLWLQISNWRAVFTASVAAVPWFAITVWSWTAPSASLTAAVRWQKVTSPRVTVYHTAALSRPVEVLKRSERFLGEVARLLDVPQPKERLRVFIFDDLQLYKAVTGSEDPGLAHLSEKAVTLLLDTNGIDCTLAHEIAHFVVHERVAKSLPSLLHEGIATFVEASFGECTARDAEDHRPSFDELSLLELADSETFHDPDADPHARYAYAGAFVTEILREHGLTKFKGFCQLVSEQRSRAWFLADEPQIVAEAFAVVYGVALAPWESSWKDSGFSSGINPR